MRKRNKESTECGRGYGGAGCPGCVGGSNELEVSLTQERLRGVGGPSAELKGRAFVRHGMLPKVALRSGTLSLIQVCFPGSHPPPCPGLRVRGFEVEPSPLWLGAEPSGRLLFPSIPARHSLCLSPLLGPSSPAVAASKSCWNMVN